RAGSRAGPASRGGPRAGWGREPGGADGTTILIVSFNTCPIIVFHDIFGKIIKIGSIDPNPITGNIDTTAILDTFGKPVSFGTTGKDVATLIVAIAAITVNLGTTVTVVMPSSNGITATWGTIGPNV